ncbi:hypothetical protein L2E82_45479 [Cichorium intybus]|uniref:Uncharacterized protein n=1 Tax=Cichorium intybus TaxID=13427 RepID=A0ACB8ZXI3_CICIN|nr:hypothetical protein L2E82_45479 [Cichorium intybus]
MHTITNFCINESFNHFSFPSHASHVSSQSPSPFEPAFYHQAKGVPEWEQAMKNELDALNANNTWDIVKLPKGKKPISCRWVYKVKLKADGLVERFKARLVAKGFTQKEEIEFHETYSPVVKFTTVRSLVALAVKNHWDIHQFDVNNAFLHGKLHEEVYMRLPPGHENTSQSLVCKLKKSLYGLKQASRQWYSKLSEALHQQGYKHSPNDHSLFLKNNGSSLVIVAIYVDDILVTGNNTEDIFKLKAFLHDKFQIKDLGFLNFFLGIEFKKVKDGMVAHQTKFIKELLQTYNVHDTTSVTTPLPYQDRFVLFGTVFEPIQQNTLTTSS